MDLEVVRVGFEVVDCVLPVGRQDVARWACEALIYLEKAISWGKDLQLRRAQMYICPQSLIKFCVWDETLR